jgi:hypothetical protein
VPDDIYQFIIAARDNASQTVGRVSKELRGLGGAASAPASRLSQLSTATGGLVSPLTLALGATAALTAGMAGAVENARKDEQSQRLLQAALEANIPAYDGNIDAIEEVIDSRLRLGFTDEEQRESLRQLVAQTKDSTKALELQRVAMDLARLRNISLTTASTLLGKVQGGNIGILARYGIQLEKGATATEAIAEITKRAAGQSEAWSQGLEGQSAALGIAFDEASEKIGYALIGPMTDVVEFLNADFVPALNETIDGLGDLGEAISGVDTWFGNLRNEIKANTDIEIDPGQWAHALHRFFTGEEEEVSEFGEHWAAAWQKVPEDVAAGYSAAQQAAAEGRAPLVAEAQSTTRQMARTFGGLPRLTADELRKEQFHFQDAVDELREYMKNYLTPKQEEMRIRGFLTSDAVADGLASGQAVIRRKTRLLVAEAQRQLEALNGWAPGSFAAQEYISGLAEGIRAGVPVIGDALYYLKVNSIGGSPARSGPMTPPRIDQAAKSTAELYSRSLATHYSRQLGTVQGGLHVPAAGISGGVGAGGGGLTINFQSTFPPKPSEAAELARLLIPAIDREQRRQRAHR